MKRRLFAGALLLIALSLMAYGTLAYFTAEETVHNVITSGDIAIELLEWADENKTIPFPQQGVSGVMPGQRIVKIVEVKNTGSGAAWVRVRVDKEITLSKGVQGEADPALLQLDYDKTSWTQSEDGFYYYNRKLLAGEVTAPLFAAVTYDPKMDNRYQNSTARVVVTAYAVQTENNGDSVTEASGWPKA